MFTVTETAFIAAPLARCFALSTDVELMQRTLDMRLVGGVTSGHIELGSRVVWRGWKFGLPQMHETLISVYDRPRYFQDRQERGRFERFQHDHHFTEMDSHTLLQDKIRFTLPFGWLGDLVAKYILVPYVAGVLHRRFQMLKRVAESEEWRNYLPDRTD